MIYHSTAVEPVDLRLKLISTHRNSCMQSSNSTHHLTVEKDREQFRSNDGDYSLNGMVLLPIIASGVNYSATCTSTCITKYSVCNIYNESIV